jgi:phosphatidate cytidylyltransferase
VTRVVSGAVLLAIAVAVVWFAPPLVFLIVAEILLAIACYELAGLTAASGLAIPFAASSFAAVLTCASFTGLGIAGWSAISLDVVLLASVLLMGVVALLGWRGGHDALTRMGVGLLPALYLGLPIGSMVAVRESRGREALFLMMLTVVVSDIAQYYAGRALGKRPLAPAISPKKTIEGAFGGYVSGAAFLAVLGAWWLPAVPLAVRVVLGVAVVTFGIAGDLFESMLKRGARVKDSSAIIPGHGGVLDRIDALLFAAPVYYVFLRYV